MVLAGFGLAALAAAFYMMVLSPKRQEAAKLADEVAQLEASVAVQEQAVAFAEQAKQNFDSYLTHLVILGKAVPEQADSASLLVQISQIAADAKVDFQAISLAEGGGTAGAAPAPPAPVSTAPTEGAATVAPTTTDATAGTAAAPVAPATEAVAASLPIGSAVGAAGYPTLPYDLTFRGRYDEVADFIQGVDELVDMHDGGQFAVDGRLVTIDGFTLHRDERFPFPTIEASFRVTTYVIPIGQGLTAGASPTAPAPVTTAPPTTIATGTTP
jgi:Tfp pilus assembly protein PilO